ncbi:DNA methyltransferase [Ensifer sp. Root278]|nr:DNA methyltransferase [Ensifer sp. Root278]
MTKLELDAPETKSADVVEENLDALRSLFPEAFREGRIDFEVLKQLLGGAVDDRDEKYGLNWHGKRKARQIALTPSTGTLLPCPKESVDWDTTQNLMIEGDNLEVLKLLQKSYAGKVKLIYIDPPYNTGKDFVYPDSFHDSLSRYLEVTRQAEGGQKISSNSEASGRFHTDWLNMLYPRLRLAKGLLRRDGVVFISIDDNEAHNLRTICDEIFGAERFVANVSVVNNMKGRNDKKYIAAAHEYALVYSGPDFRSYGLPLTEEQRAAFKFKDEKGQVFALRDMRKRGGPDKREDRPKMFFPVYWDEATGRCSLERTSDTDVEILPMRGDGSEGRWRWGIDKARGHLDWLHPKRSERTGRLDVEHRLYLDPSIAVDDDEEPDGEDDEDVIERSSKPKSIWIGGEFSTDSGKRALKQLMPGEAFDFPKAVEFLKTCIRMGASDGDVVLDLFAGSGTTAEAVMRLNHEDGNRRRYILVQLPEPLRKDDKNQKAAAAVCEALNLTPNIAELTKERLRRAGAKVKTESPLVQGDVGFRVFKLAQSNIRAWEPEPSNIEGTLLANSEHLIQGRSEQDVLYELLLKLGLDLCVPIEKKEIAGKTVHSIGGGALIACLADGLTKDVVEALANGIVAWRKALAPAVDTRVVFKDSGFADDVAKTNMAAILNQNGILDVRSL